ncbi:MULTISPECIES: ProQ/FINO family protein [unclassified Rhizobium]|uniref:ProQ/FINO family protein n=1 Tax=unclassified Rhizobium TaxID=2613769 RepID=UPI0007E9BF9A|nr:MULTISPECIES: ProQ/FINO family protein [unclassified Rhizobium]ANM14379.1 conjugation repressor FinO/ProQ protein [Rhizobium sp. N324]ANM20763.1 conjugation repressor FinO/ProQ protein [Rhizobium sp. N541]ANM27148.1 conjugation repressor FinO/ProQ protein [Rhizobium sp. N941]OYC99476.1 conjugation repressor FinO/ProQ protein [Rhizobium sp. N4311]
MDKPWKISRGPIAATELDVEKATAINMLLIRPVAVLPAKAGDPIRPFAVGLFNELRPLLKPDAGVTALRRATAAYVHCRRYYFASAQPDAMRHDLAGEPVEPLSPEDRLVAQKRFLSLKQSTSKAEAPEQPAPVPPPLLSKSEQIRAALLGKGNAVS